MTRKRLGFFTRLLDDATPKERYRLATEQIRHAERHGFDSAWIAQHHFHESEGGLPSPLLFLAHVPRIPKPSGWARPSSPCRWKTRCAWRKMRRCWIYSPMDVSKSVLVRAARRPLSCRSD
jgi:hypothetical protein